MAAESVVGRAQEAFRRVLPRRFRRDIPVVPVVRLSGLIGFSTPLRPGLTLASSAQLLDRAFAHRRPAAVALVINSPGGSAVQSHLIFTRIRQLASERSLRVIAFVEDVAASGGYMIACAADEIVVDETSIVGSVGVVGGSFGFHRLLEKLGVERRLYTSGERKAMLDPFLPERPDDVERLKVIQREIHEFFIALVKNRRGDRLQPGETNLFSGEYWTGRRGVELGLADRIGDMRSVLRERFGEQVQMPVITAARGLLRRAFGGTAAAAIMPAEFDRPSFAADLLSAAEARALWGRYGL